MPRPSRSPHLRRCDERVLRRAFAAGAARHGEFPLQFARYAEHALAQVRSRLQHAGLAPTPARVSRELAQAAAADLYLALACDDGLTGAWEAFATHFLPRVRGLLRQAGAPEQLADEITESLPGDLIAAPGTTGACTRLGTYDGSGSLFGWLAIIALRALALARRERRLASGGPEPCAQTHQGPAAQADSAETGAHFGLALRAAWQTLNDRERIAVACKYGDGLKQTAIALLLGVGPPRVSRILGTALTKIRTVLETRLGPAAGTWTDFGGLRDVLRDVVGLHLATSSGAPPPAGREDLDHGPARTR